MKRLIGFNANVTYILSLIVGLGALVWLGRRFVLLADRPFDFSTPIFGTPGAPYTDALGPWVWGGICYLFRFPVPEILYRPSIGLFWGSIIAITERIYTIPIWFGVWFFAGTASLIWSMRANRTGLAVAFWLCTANLVFEEGLTELNIITDAVDFPAWVLTVLGTLFILCELTKERMHLLGLAAGSALLGIAAAIRGPMMIGGPVILAAGVLSRKRFSVVSVIVVTVAFTAPVVIDVGLQRYHHTVNNGVVSMYCAYSDPTGSWTPECHARYLSEHHTPKDVFIAYARTMLTVERAPQLWHMVANRVERDTRKLTSGNFLVIAIAALLIGCLIVVRGTASESLEVHGSARLRSLAVPLLTFLLISLASSLSGGASEDLRSFIAVSLACALALLAVLRHRWIEFGFITGYLAAVIFMVVLGLWAYERVSATFSFLVYLSAILLLIPDFSPAIAPSVSSLRLLTVGTLTMVVTLYTAVFWWPAELPKTFARDVQSRSAAMKLSDDASVNRALYINGDRNMFYTPFDGAPIGSVRPYRELRYGDRLWNNSFLKPNEFVD